MSTALVQYQKSDFSVLANGSELAAAMLENGDGAGFLESDFPRVKTPSGGGMFWTINGANGMESTAAIEGVIVFRCQKGILWKADETSDDKPVLVSDDMKYARLNIPWEEVPADMQQVLPNHEVPAEVLKEAGALREDSNGNPVRYFYWDGPNKLPYCEFGSSTKAGSKGKKAKDYQILYVLRRNEALPLRIQLGPTSIMPIRKFFRQLNVPHTMAYVSLGLKVEKSSSGKDYSVVVPTRTATLSPEAAADMKMKYKEELQRMHDAGRLNIVDSAAE